MASLKIGIKRATGLNRKFIVEVDAGKFERLAAGFGLFNNEFLNSIGRAESDIKAGRVRKIRSLRFLRNK